MPYSIVDTGLGTALRIKSAVLSQDKDILDTECKTHVGLPLAYASEGISEVDVVQTEEGSILYEVVRIGLLTAVHLSPAGPLYYHSQVRNITCTCVEA